MENLSRVQKRLLSRIKEILWQSWDPIGVNDGDNEWDDEYDSYAPHVFRLAIEGNDAYKIAQSLSLSATQNMGITSNKAHDLKVALEIIQAKKEIVG